MTPTPHPRVFADERLLRGRNVPVIVVRASVDFVFEVGEADGERYIGREWLESDWGTVIDAAREVQGEHGEDPFAEPRERAHEAAFGAPVGSGERLREETNAGS